jgi:hypothetical protein
MKLDGPGVRFGSPFARVKPYLWSNAHAAPTRLAQDLQNRHLAVFLFPNPHFQQPSPHLPYGLRRGGAGLVAESKKVGRGLLALGI